MGYAIVDKKKQEISTEDSAHLNQKVNIFGSFIKKVDQNYSFKRHVPEA